MNSQLRRSILLIILFVVLVVSFIPNIIDKNFTQSVGFYFNKLPPDSGLFFGKEGYLFPVGDLIPRTDPKLKQKLHDNLKNLKKAQVILKNKGILLVPILIPNKASALQDYLSINLDNSRINSLNELRPQLKNLEIDFLDFETYFLAFKKKYKIEFYEPYGRHWNKIAGCLMSNALVNKYLSSTKKILDFECENYISKKTEYPDDDLLFYLNIAPYLLRHKNSPNYNYGYPQIDPLDDLSILFVGSSFNWQIMYDLDSRKITKNIFYYSYNSNLCKIPKLEKIDLKKGSIEWINFILSNQLITIDIFESFIPDMYEDFFAEIIQYF